MIEVDVGLRLGAFDLEVAFRNGEGVMRYLANPVRANR